MMEIDNRVMIYETGAKAVKFNLDEKTETLWATQAQISELFDVNTQAIGKHLKHIYQEGELEEERTCSISEQVQIEGDRSVLRKVKVYNLDAIISVGYRVSSRKATDFRIWATNMLHKYVVDGVAVNEGRLKELSSKRLEEVSGTLTIVQRLLAQNSFSDEEAKGVLEVIANYARTFRTLKEYDEGFVKFQGKARARKVLEAGQCVEMIDALREEMHAGEMFGKLRGDEFEGILRTIYQTFGGEEVYPTLAEKAANLLYFIIKDHPFVDGNKRIGALLFIMFLTVNEYQLTKAGEAKISDKALTALALMIAESDPREKGLIVAGVCRMLEE